MRSIQKRLEELEKTVNPSGGIAMVFVRPGYKENDYANQMKEYFDLWGRRHHPIFLVLTEFCDFDYETFIQKMRARCPSGNCFAGWWDKKEYPCASNND